MQIKVLRDEKDVLEIEIDNLTIIEILRVYLNKGESKLAVWKREHPTKNPILHIEGNNPKKLLKQAISSIDKEIESFISDFKKLK